MASIIDIHVHCDTFKGLPRINRQPMISVDKILQKYESLGIRMGVLQPLLNPEFGPFPQSNEDMIQITQAYPDRFVTFCNIDPRTNRNSARSDLAKQVKAYKRAGCKGVGEICSVLPFDDPRVENLFSACQDLQMPILFHLAPEPEGYYGLFDTIGLPGLEKALKKFPRLIFLGHSQPFWSEISSVGPHSRKKYPSGKMRKKGRVIALMEQYPNLHGDLSGWSGLNAISRDPKRGTQFLNTFSDRLYFGTDYIGTGRTKVSLPYLKKLLKQKMITDETFKRICYKNAMKLLKIAD